jgi:hypothetical protein
MLVDSKLLHSYKEFQVTDKIRVRKDVIYNFLIASLSAGGMFQLPVIDYVMRQKNELTIAEIEFNPNLIIEVYFSFNECDGQLHYGQFTKCFPTFFIINPSDIKD